MIHQMDVTHVFVIMGQLCVQKGLVREKLSGRRSLAHIMALHIKMAKVLTPLTDVTLVAVMMEKLHAL